MATNDSSNPAGQFALELVDILKRLGAHRRAVHGQTYGNPPWTREQSDAYFCHPLVRACEWLEQRVGISRHDLEDAAFRLTTPQGLRGMDPLTGPGGRTTDAGQPDLLWMIPKFRELDRDGTTARLWELLVEDYPAILANAGMLVPLGHGGDGRSRPTAAPESSPPKAQPAEAAGTLGKLLTTDLPAQTPDEAARLLYEALDDWGQVSWSDRHFDDPLVPGNDVFDHECALERLVTPEGKTPRLPHPAGTWWIEMVQLSWKDERSESESLRLVELRGKMLDWLREMFPDAIAIAAEPDIPSEDQETAKTLDVISRYASQHYDHMPSTRSIQKWRDHHSLRMYKRGQLWVFSRSDLETLVRGK